MAHQQKNPVRKSLTYFYIKLDGVLKNQTVILDTKKGRHNTSLFVLYFRNVYRMCTILKIKNLQVVNLQVFK